MNKLNDSIQTEFNSSYYEVFAQKKLPKNASKAYCNYIDKYDDLKAITELSDFSGIFFIQNKETHHVILFDKNKVYATSEKNFDQLVKEKNIYTQTTDDIINDETLSDADIGYDWVSRNYISYKFRFPLWSALHPYGYWGDEPRNLNLTVNEKIVLSRIIFCGITLLFTDNMFIKSKVQSNDKTKLDNVFFDQKSEFPLYREFFINRPLEYTIKQSSYSLSDYDYIDEYFTDNLDDYKNKNYGVLFNLDKISILKKSTDGYEMVNKIKESNSYSYSNYYVFHSMTISQLSSFSPRTYHQALSVCQTKLMKKLEENYPKVYKRVSAGLEEFKIRKSDTRPFAFELSSSARGTFTVSNLRRNDLTTIETNVDGMKSVKDIFTCVASVDLDKWIIFNNRLYINKDIIKEQKYEYSIDTKSTYYGGNSLLLTLKFGRRKYNIYNPDVDMIDQFYQAGAFDEEKSNLLKCELLLKQS